MRRADLVALSKCDPNQTLPVWTVAVRRWFAGTLVKFRHATLEVRRATDHAPMGIGALSGKSVFAFSGIGDHESFIRGLAGLGCVVRGERRFPDHHRYTERDTGMLAAALKTTVSEMFITTEKDVMRLEAVETLRRSFLEPLPVFYATVSVEILEGASVLTSAIDRCLKGGAN
jgi:tetraacyldisaccharide 4'-kinase